jgi:MinD-like ATPase involved in chromosome partitioning or flagellar assembly
MKFPGIKKDAKEESPAAVAFEGNQPVNVIVVGPGNVGTPFLALAPGNPSGVQMVSVIRDAADLKGDLERFKPHIVLLSPEARNYHADLVYELTNNPDGPLAVVALAPPTGTFGQEMAQQGAVGFYTTPITTAIVEKFAAEARSLYDLAREKWHKPLIDSGVDRRTLESIGAQAYKTGVVTFWSTKGGDGKTILAVNTACLLGLFAGKHVLLIDTDMNCGRVHLHLEIKPEQNTLFHLASDYMTNNNTLTGQILRRRVVSVDRIMDPRTKVVEPRLDVLFGLTDILQSSHPALKGEQGQAFMMALLDLAQRLYDFVLVDMGSNTQIGTHFGSLMSSDMVIFICSSDKSSLMPNRDTVKRLIQQADIAPDKFFMVLNRYDARDGLSPKDISEYMGMPLAAVVAEDTSREMMLAVNDGKPFVLSHLGKNNAAAEQTMHGLLAVAETIYPPMGQIITERSGGRGRRLFKAKK